MKKATTEDKQVALREDFALGQAASKLVENKAWKTVTKWLEEDIQEVLYIKANRPAADYLTPHKVVNLQGQEEVISGIQLLEQQVRDEIRITAYQELFAMVGTLIDNGKKSEEVLKK